MLQLLFHKVLVCRTRMLGTASRGIMESMFDTYRPELYYMRGPGPKWRARHLNLSDQ
jgi:hypothetical protein